MEVRIEHSYRTEGFFKPIPFFEVFVSVRFTKAQLAIIDRANLYDLLVAERKSHPASGGVHPDPLYLHDLIDNETEGFAFPTQPEAKAYEEKVVEGLARIKQLVDANARPLSSRTEIIE